jgi:hypothetical protein
LSSWSEKADLGGVESSRSRLLSPSSTAAVVLGAHDWTEAGLGRAPSFLRSARRVVRYLYDSVGLGLDPELVLDLFDDTAGAGDQLARVRDTLDVMLRDRREAGRPITDVLVYYVGHGQTDDEGHLSLLVRRSRKGLEAETGIKAPDLARTLRLAAPQQRRLVILDCCFSEAAARDFIGQSGALDQAVAATATKDLRDDQPARGTLLLCSSSVGEVSMGAPNAERTLFTGAVLEVLQRGAEGQPPYLSFADLRDAAFDRMVVSFGANAPRPALHQVNAAKGDLTRAPAFPNRAAADAGTGMPHTEPPPPFQAKILQRAQERTEVASPTDAKALVDKGLQLGRSEAAIAAYDDLLARFGTATEVPIREQIARALVNKGTTLGALGRSEAAIAAYDDLLARFGTATEAPIRDQVAIALRYKEDTRETLKNNADTQQGAEREPPRAQAETIKGPRIGIAAIPPSITSSQPAVTRPWSTWLSRRAILAVPIVGCLCYATFWAVQEQAARDQPAQEQATRDQAARDQAAREQAARDQAARDLARREALALPASAYQATPNKWMAFATIVPDGTWVHWGDPGRDKAIAEVLSSCKEKFQNDCTIQFTSNSECLAISRRGTRFYWTSDISPRQAALVAINKCETASRAPCGLHFTMCPNGTGYFERQTWPDQ